MAKITKGSSFGGAVKYILDPKKQTELLGAEGIRLKDYDSITRSFELQTRLNPRVSRSVGHISLDFSAQDSGKLNSVMMVQIALEYMKLMGIRDTQFIIGRHYDKEHPHIHLLYNRVDNQGCTISDKNDRFRSTKICRELTEKYGLYISSGKEQVKEHRLKEPDKTKYEIYNVLKRAVPRCHSWQELKAQLQRDGIAVEFKMRSGTNEPQGIKFSKNGYHFNGSKVDRQFSYSKINFALQQNERVEIKEHSQQNNSDTNFSFSTGLLNFEQNPAVDPEEEAFRRRMQRKKRKGISM